MPNTCNNSRLSLNTITPRIDATIGSTFAINATIIKNKGYKIVSYIAYGLIAVSCVLFLLLIWVGGDIIFKAAIIVGVSSIFANIIMGNVVALGKKYFNVQLIEYAMVYNLCYVE